MATTKGAHRVNYLVHCSRIMEISALAYFSSTNKKSQTRVGKFLKGFVTKEAGCSRPLSDYYAVSSIAGLLALIAMKESDVVRKVLASTVIWICDNYEKRMGLASLASEEQDEINKLFGYPFEFVEVSGSKTSFLATCMADLAAFIEDEALYTDIINDIKACEVHLEYWQPRDSLGACQIEGQDVLGWPAVAFNDAISDSDKYGYANHMAEELDTFRPVSEFGPLSSMLLMLFLRDRYFPKIWKPLVSNASLPATRSQTRSSRPSAP